MKPLYRGLEKALKVRLQRDHKTDVVRYAHIEA